jgi:ABC-type multidrug transport system fused ATPase/permease subunit
MTAIWKLSPFLIACRIGNLNRMVTGFAKRKDLSVQRLDSNASEVTRSRLSGSNRFLLNHGQTFNNPMCHHWPAIFWPGYTAATLFKRQRTASCSSKMISFSNIHKQYGKQLLFVDASFQLNPGEKVGLVGPNGSGRKTGVCPRSFPRSFKPSPPTLRFPERTGVALRSDLAHDDHQNSNFLFRLR